VPPLSRSAFAAALPRGPDLAAFVVALERARGRAASAEDGVVTVDDGDRERRLWVHDPGPLGRRPLDPPTDADRVVTPLRDPPDPGVPVVDADDLRDRALYDVPRAARESLFETHLGRGPDTADARGPPAAALAVAAIVVAAAVALAAGAGGAPEAGAPDDPATRTTPDDPYPPGLSDAGVTDPDALGRAHVAGVSNESYFLTSVRTVRGTNGTLRSRLALLVWTDERRRFLVDARTAGPDAPVLLGDPPARGLYWSNGTTYARRLVRDGEQVYNTFEPSGGAGTWRYWTATAPFGGDRARPAETYARTFAAVPTRVVTTREPDGVRRHLVVGEGRADPGALRVGTDPRAVELTAEVTPEGLVRSLRLSYVATLDGERVRVTWRIRYEVVGRTTVPEPPWLDRALRGDRAPARGTANATAAPQA
jgi:hypothetical protein